MKKEVLQWHPAFFAGLQIELQEDRDNPVKKNIGRILFPLRNLLNLFPQTRLRLYLELLCRIL